MKTKILLIIVLLSITIVGYNYKPSENNIVYTPTNIPNYEVRKPEEYNAYIGETVEQNYGSRQDDQNYSVLIGDSITYHLKEDVNMPENTYDVGIPGATSYDIQRDLDQIYFSLDTSKITDVYITLGTNDLILTGQKSDYGASDTVNNINLIVESIYQDNPYINIYVISPFPNRGDLSDRIPDNNVFLDEVTDLLAVDLDSRAIYLNVNDKIKDDAGLLPRNYTEDGLHLNTLGYQRIIGIIKEEIELQN